MQIKLKIPSVKKINVRTGNLKIEILKATQIKWNAPVITNIKITGYIKFDSKGESSFVPYENPIITEYELKPSADNTLISINGKIYKVKDDSEFAIKIMKTMVKSQNGATGLIKFLIKGFQNWIPRIIDNVKPLNFK